MRKEAITRDMSAFLTQCDGSLALNWHSTCSSVLQTVLNSFLSHSSPISPSLPFAIVQYDFICLAIHPTVHCTSKNATKMPDSVAYEDGDEHEPTHTDVDLLQHHGKLSRWH